MREALKELGILIWEIFYPRTCFVCGIEIADGLFCDECRRGLYVGKEIAARENLTGIWILFAYDQGVKEALHRIKFAGAKSLPLLLRSETGMVMATEPWPCFLNMQALATGIPTDARRKKERGFDLPEVIFKEVLARHKIFWQEVLVRQRPTEPLFDLNPEERRLCLEGCFKVIGDVRGKQIILTDDILTTGATMQEAARVLKLAGASNVVAITFAGARANL